MEANVRTIQIVAGLTTGEKPMALIVAGHSTRCQVWFCSKVDNSSLMAAHQCGMVLAFRYERGSHSGVRSSQRYCKCSWRYNEDDDLGGDYGEAVDPQFERERPMYGFVKMEETELMKMMWVTPWSLKVEVMERVV
ncbi:hypothetical protein PIB30_020415 [Stylosanthes scabra]|uniref:Uncharacterized protein n=1 Tax=Stylosanthes scabra TaxID=79078 RepID=A0ABU6S968_9FABA|nr:hypothetical protein [Stylosanthes scabra]